MLKKNLKNWAYALSLILVSQLVGCAAEEAVSDSDSDEVTLTIKGSGEAE